MSIPEPFTGKSPLPGENFPCLLIILWQNSSNSILFRDVGTFLERKRSKQKLSVPVGEICYLSWVGSWVWKVRPSGKNENEAFGTSKCRSSGNGQVLEIHENQDVLKNRIYFNVNSGLGLQQAGCTPHWKFWWLTQSRHLGLGRVQWEIWERCCYGSMFCPAVDRTVARRKSTQEKRTGETVILQQSRGVLQSFYTDSPWKKPSGLLRYSFLRS